jgi:hypothetical protein
VDDSNSEPVFGDLNAVKLLESRKTSLSILTSARWKFGWQIVFRSQRCTREFQDWFTAANDPQQSEADLDLKNMEYEVFAVNGPSLFDQPSQRPVWNDTSYVAKGRLCRCLDYVELHIRPRSGHRHCRHPDLLARSGFRSGANVRSVVSRMSLS